MTLLVNGEFKADDYFERVGKTGPIIFMFISMTTPMYIGHLVLRDYLRNHPDEVERYSSLKEELAQRYDDTAFYSKAKKPFVEEMEQRALNWFENQGPKIY